MFAEQSNKLVKKLIQAEYKNAVDNYEATYKDLREAESILLEEVEEADAEIENLDLRFSEADWIDGSDLKTDLNKMKKYAMNCMKELAQVCAVITKIQLSNLGK